MWVWVRDRVKVRFRVTCISLKGLFCFDLSSLGWEEGGGGGGRRGEGGGSEKQKQPTREREREKA